MLVEPVALRSVLTKPVSPSARPVSYTHLDVYKRQAYIFFDDVPDAPESDASTDTATKSTKASSVSFQPAAAAEAEDDCCSGKIIKPAQDTNAKA